MSKTATPKATVSNVGGGVASIDFPPGQTFNTGATGDELNMFTDGIVREEMSGDEQDDLDRAEGEEGDMENKEENDGNESGEKEMMEDTSPDKTADDVSPEKIDDESPTKTFDDQSPDKSVDEEGKNSEKMKIDESSDYKDKINVQRVDSIVYDNVQSPLKEAQAKSLVELDSGIKVATDSISNTNLSEVQVNKAKMDAVASSNRESTEDKVLSQFGKLQMSQESETVTEKYYIQKQQLDGE